MFAVNGSDLPEFPLKCGNNFGIISGKEQNDGPYRIEGEEGEARSACRWPGALSAGETERRTDMVPADAEERQAARLWLGSALDVSLADARDAAAMLRRQVRDGADQVAKRRMARTMVPIAARLGASARSKADAQY